MLRNCIADEAKNRAVSSGFSGATEPGFALFVGSRAVAVEGTESVQECGGRHAITLPVSARMENGMLAVPAQSQRGCVWWNFSVDRGIRYVSITY
jgi:hypothetical protein